MQGHTSTFKRCTVGILSLLMALQPIAGQAQAIGQALRDADKPHPHVLPIATAPDMLPLPYVPAAWRARAAAHVDSSEIAVPASVATPAPAVLVASESSSGGGTKPISVGVEQSKALATSISALTASPSPIVFGNSVALTATVSVGAGTTVAGSVNFTEGTTTLCSAVALAGTSASSKTATCTVPATANAGVHSYVASFVGNATVGASTATLSHTINNAAPALTVASSVASPTTVQSFILTATASLATATGTVDFKEGTLVRCAAVLLVGTTSKTATCTVPATTLGVHSYTASYSGDGNHNTATQSTSVTVVAPLATSTTTLTVTPSPSAFDGSRTLTATVLPVTASGTVNFTEAGTSLPGCAAIALTGTTTKTATCTVAATTPAASVGSHTYAAAYSGDTSIATSTASATHVVNKATATASVAALPTVLQAGQSFTLTAAIAPVTATGTVAFSDGTTALPNCSAVTVTGTTAKTATCTVATSNTTAGTHTYNINYSGDASYSSATAQLITNIASAPRVSTTTLTASPNPGEVGAVVLLTTTVTPSSATGTVAFTEGGNVITGCNSVALTGSDTKKATCTVAKTAVTLGSHAYAAAYSGDGTVAGSNGSLSFTVGKRTTSFTTTTTPEAPLANASFTVKITVDDPLATGTVSVSEGTAVLCSSLNLPSTAPKFVTCTIPATSAATHSYKLSYSGDANVNALTSTVSIKVKASDNGGEDDDGSGIAKDDDGLNVGALVTALRPVCTPLTASTTNALIGQSITLTVNCTFRGKLARSFAFYRTGPNNTVTYLGDSTPAGSVTFTTTAPTTPGVYTYSFVALNGHIASALVPGVAVTVTIAPPSSCTVTGPAALASSAAGTYAVTCTGGSPITGYSWSRSPALASTAVSNAATLTDIPFVGANINLQNTTYSLIVSNSAGSVTVVKIVGNSSYNAAPTVTLVVPASAVAVNYGVGFSGIAATANDADQGVAKVVISDNGTPIATCTYSPPVPNKVQDCKTVTTGAVTAPIALPLTAAVGPHVITAVATDALGVNSTVATQTITVNPVAPSSCTITGPSGLASNTAGTFAVNCTGGSPIASYVWTRTPALAAAVATPGLTDTPFTGANVNSATASYSVTVTNSVGSSTATLSVANTSANVLPTVAITSPAATPPTVLVYSPTATFPVTAMANDADQGITSIQLQNNGVNLGAACTFTATANTARTCTAALPAGTPVGAQRITAIAADGKGATVSSDALVITVNPAPMSCVMSADPASPVVGTTTVITVTCSAAADALVGSAVAVAGVAVVWTGGCASSTTVTDANGKATCTTAALTGASVYSVTVSKANYSVAVVGGTGTTANATITITPSTTAQRKLSLSNAALGTVRIGGTVSFTAQASDGTALTPTNLSLSADNTATWASISCTGGGCTVGGSPNASGVFTLGVTLTDAAGATSSASTIVAVSDPIGVTELTKPGTVGVGTTAGQFAVSESGAATYSIPIQVPPGVAGLQPNLALIYNSQGGDGHLGVGWNVSGVSSITRCPKTIATDGVREPINYDNVTDPVNGNDAFCLDGQRLIPVSGGITSAACVWPPGSSTTPNNQCAAWEFRTEVESYSRIVGIGDNAVAGSTGSGPTRFRVYAKSGQILEFGSRWWGLGAPRPDPQTSLITNPSFEDTDLNDSCWIYGSIDPYLRDFSGQYVVLFTSVDGTPTYAPNPCFGNSTVPQNWPGYALTPPNVKEYGLFKTYATGASTAGWTFAIDQRGNSGVQKSGSGFSPNGLGNPPSGLQTAFLQSRGLMTTRPFLEEGWYTLGFSLAGRGTSGAGFGGNQIVEVRLDGQAKGRFTTTTGQPFTAVSMQIYVPSSAQHDLTFAGMIDADEGALLDAITFVPRNNDIYSLKVFPLDRVEDRNGNYMHIDYGGTHDDQTLNFPDGSIKKVDGTLQPSYGSAELTSVFSLSRTALIAQGARPALEMYPRRFTYGMRTATPGNGTNQGTDPAATIETAHVILNYGDRPDVTKGYDTGSGQMLLSKRLESVVTTVGGVDDSSTRTDRDNFHINEKFHSNSNGPQCFSGDETSVCGAVYRRYLLDYRLTQSPSTGRSRLQSVTECGGDGTCLRATEFDWQNPALALTTPDAGQGYQEVNDGTDWNNLLSDGRVGDIVGDGRSRIIKRIGNGQAVSVCTYDATLKKFSCSVWQLPQSGTGFQYELPGGGANNSWFLADINGDGIADVVGTSTNGTSFGCISTGSGFGACANVPKAPPLPADGSFKARQWFKTGDFVGDGRLDIAFYRGNGNFEICRPSGGTVLQPALSWTCNAPTPIEGLPIGFNNASTELQHLIVADFNGDGRADLAYRVANICVEGGIDSYGKRIYPPLPQQQCKDSAGNGIEPTVSDSYWSVCFASGPASAVTFRCATHSGGGLNGAVKAVSGKPSLVATYDFNGDGLADLASYVAATATTPAGWRVCLSTGDGEFAERDGNGDCPVWPGPIGTTEKTVAGDFNGDGRTDLATWVTGDQWQICLSTGTGFTNCDARFAGPPEPANCDNDCTETFPGDYNGDGKTDLAVNTNCVVQCGRLSYRFTGGDMPDLLASVTTGLGASTTIKYEPLSKPNGVYQKQLSVANDPNFSPVLDNEIVIQSPMYVVASTTASTATASGERYKTKYAYESLRADKVGRGLYGFYRRSIQDNIIVDASGNEDLSQVHTTAMRNSQQWPNVGRPLQVSKYVAGSLVSDAAMLYGLRSNFSGTTRPIVGGPYTRYEAFQTQSTQTGRDLPTAATPGGAALPTTTVYTGFDPDTGADNLAAFYDAFGNPKKVITRTQHPTNGEVWSQSVVNKYFNEADGGGDTTRWLLGKLQTAATTSSVSGYSTNAPASSAVRASLGPP